MPLELDLVRAGLPRHNVVYFETCTSTMTEAASLAHGACPPGTVVVADEQTAGQGRHGRVWHSEPGAGLYVSFVFRMSIQDPNVRLLSMALGLAAAEAIARTADIPCDLRWPNDVMIGEKKCSGILVQVEPGALVAGIGINVNHTAFPPDLAAIATSLRLATGSTHSREHLLVHLVETVEGFTRMLLEGGPEPILRAFTRASSYVSGKSVMVEQGDTAIEGITDGLDPSGFLYVRKPDGTRTVILAGGVRPR